MEVLTLCVAMVAFVVGNIITFRKFLGRRNNGQPKTGAFRSSLIGFVVSIGIIVVYMLAGHLIWRIFG